MRALLFDTETTGLVGSRLLALDRQPEVIEFYGCLADVDTGKVEKEVEHLIKPRTPIAQAKVKGKRSITDITGIDDEMVKEAPGFEDVADEVFALIEEAPLVIAHNLSFDVEVVDIEAERLGRTIKWPDQLCTVEVTVHLKGFRMTLSDLYQHLFGETFLGAHRARADVEALLRCCTELRKRDVI